MNFLAVFLCATFASSYGELKPSRCQVNISCPCGKTGLNYTFCLHNTPEDADVCRRWATCKACHPEINHCTECLPGHVGPTCLQVPQDSLLIRDKRSPLSNVEPQEKILRADRLSCPNPELPKHVSIRCVQKSSRTCIAKCLPGYVFETREEDEVRLKCIRGYWEPLVIPACISQGECEVETSGRGSSSFNCTISIQGTICDVLCDRRHQGRYFCYPGREWEPKLPYCIKEKGTSGLDTRDQCRCPNGRKCDRYGRCSVCPPGRGGIFCGEVLGNATTCTDPGIVPEADRLRSDGSPSTFKEVFFEGESVIFSCQSKRYVLVGASILKCANGAWSNPLPRCVKPGVFCPDPGQVDNAVRHNTDDSLSRRRENPSYESGQSVVFACNPGYALHGSSYIRCLPTGMWSSEKPFCSSTLGPENVIRNSTAKLDPDVVYCIDPGSISNGDWKSYPPINDPIMQQGFRQGSWIQFACNEGFHLRGEKSIFCMVTGEWSALNPTCEKNRRFGSGSLTFCEHPGPIINGRMVVYPATEIRYRPTVTEDTEDSEYPEGTLLQFSCEDGYDLTGPSSITCDDGGLWSALPPYCVDDSEFMTFCGKPGPIENGRVLLHPSLDGGRRPMMQDERFPQGTRVQFLCEEGYSLSGASSATCGNDGFWSPGRPSCEKEATTPEYVMYCDNRGPLANGKVTVVPDKKENEPKSDNPEEYPQGTRVDYSCEEGYILKGQSSVTCEKNGFWSAGVPTCETGTCGQSMLQTVGKITHGERTKAGEWPWTVAIAINNENTSNVVCGGALIDTQTVVTAAHCFDTADDFELFFGKYRRNTADDDEKVQKRTNLTVIIHTNYNNQTLDSDIALVRFTPRIKYTDRVQPICLPSYETTAENIRRGKKGYVTGWGLNEKDMPSDALFMAHLPVLPADYCVKAYEKQGLQLPITSNMFCAGFEEGGTNACTGDSGSPMVFLDKKLHRYTAEGLVSFGVTGECGLPRRYTVFTKIQPYLPWIFTNKS